MPSQEEKEAAELAFLTAAQDTCTLIPLGIAKKREAPDFKLVTESGSIGIEVAELLRPAELPKQSPPIEAENFHRQVVEKAQDLYYERNNAVPAAVHVFFTHATGRTDRGVLSRKLADVVGQNIHRANPTINLSRAELPGELSAISITAESGCWHSGEHGAITLPLILGEIHDLISQKELLLSNYRRNLPDIPIWLLLYTGAHRGFELPSQVVDLSCPFTFDRVLWYSQLDRKVIEIPPKTL
jgi:hypothetical protein